MGEYTDVGVQMIPGTFKYTVEGSTPSFADNEGQVIEAQTQVRLRIKGIRSELGQMFAIGSIREDYLGYDLLSASTEAFTLLTMLQSSLAVAHVLRTAPLRHCTTIRFNTSARRWEALEAGREKTSLNACYDTHKSDRIHEIISRTLQERSLESQNHGSDIMNVSGVGHNI